jgi:hypothetical protein
MGSHSGAADSVTSCRDGLTQMISTPASRAARYQYVLSWLTAPPESIWVFFSAAPPNSTSNLVCATTSGQRVTRLLTSARPMTYGMMPCAAPKLWLPLLSV